MCSPDIFLGLVAILFPPLAVWVKRGICSADSIINILLCVLGFIPGLLHAWYIIAKFPDDAYADYDRLPRDGGERGERVTYVFAAPQQNHPNMNYGTAGAHQQQQEEGRVHAGPSSSAAAGSSTSPPSYAEAVKGDNKIQTQD